MATGVFQNAFPFACFFSEEDLMLRLFLSSFIDGSPPVLGAPSILSEKMIFVLDNGKGKEFRKLPFVANLFDMVSHSLR